METSTNAARVLPPVISVQDLTHSVERLTDSELLAGTRRLVGRSNQLLAELLAHLGEVEARGIHRIRASSSLYTYCIYELRFSEDEAFRRVAAARLIRRFPALLEAVSAGELHLTGLLMLGPHLTESNLVEVLRATVLVPCHCTRASAGDTSRRRFAVPYWGATAIAAPTWPPPASGASKRIASNFTISRRSRAAVSTPLRTSPYVVRRTMLSQPRRISGASSSRRRSARVRMTPFAIRRR